MHPKFELRGFMTQLDSPCYITGIHTNGFGCSVRVYVMSCLINKELLMPMFGGRSPDWLGEPR